MPIGTFEFDGKGLSVFGLYLVNAILCLLTLGLYFPWAYVSMQRWICKHTTIEGRPLTFRGSGAGFFGQYLLIIILCFVTLGLYTPWGFCQFKRWQTRNTYFAGVGDNENY